MIGEPIAEQDITFYGLDKAVDAAQQVIDDFVRVATPLWGMEVEEMIGPLRAAAAGGQVEGRVALQAGLPAGLIILNEKEGRGRIAFVHAVGEREAVVAGLEQQAVAALRQAGARRITHEVALAMSEAPVQEVLSALGFAVIPRLIMGAAPQPGAEPPALPDGYDLEAWDQRYVEDVVDVIHEANRDTLDALIYPSFQTREGTAATVQHMVGEGNGSFDPTGSAVILCQGRVVGCLIFSQQPPGEGFVDEVSIVPAHQGRRLGRVLMMRALASAHERRMPVVRLGVTEANAAAVSLYHKLGFKVQQRMIAYVWQAE